MASGSTNNFGAQRKGIGLHLTWSSTAYDENYSYITLTLSLQHYSLSMSDGRSGTLSVSYSCNGVPYNETQSFSIGAIRYSGSAIRTTGLASCTFRVWHNRDGTSPTVTISGGCALNINYNGHLDGLSISTQVTLDKITTYKLKIDTAEGSFVTVNKTASGYGELGLLSNDSYIYHNDKLKITFTPSSNYAITTHTVNGNTFDSGNTHTVGGNVTITARAQVLSSSVGATDADIESISSVIITRYNGSYWHSLSYEFGTQKGYISQSGDVLSNEEKFNTTSVPFKIPASFYKEIPNTRTGKCTITCRTYSDKNGTSVLGTPTSCTFTITATGAPKVEGNVVDVNETTKALTGSEKTLIRYKSTALATINASAVNGASISSKFINGGALPTNTRTYNNCSETKFVFKTTDSRGYASSCTISPTVIEYVNLTINPILTRPSPTKNDIAMSFNGDFYRGSFGKAANTLTLSYRYKTSGEGVYNDWKNIEPENIEIGVDAYESRGTITLKDEFDYKTEYVIQVKAKDGARVEGKDCTLSEVIKTITIPRGIPVFDWGKEDFMFHVPVHSTDGFTYDTPVLEKGSCNEFLTSGNYYIGSEVTDKPDKVASTSGWLAVRSCGGNCYQSYITPSQEKYERWRTDKGWEKWCVFNNRIPQVRSVTNTVVKTINDGKVPLFKLSEIRELFREKYDYVDEEKINTETLGIILVNGHRRARPNCNVWAEWDLEATPERELYAITSSSSGDIRINYTIIAFY